MLSPVTERSNKAGASVARTGTGSASTALLSRLWSGMVQKYFTGPDALNLASKRDNHSISKLKELRKEIMAAPAEVREGLAVRAAALASVGAADLDCISRLTYSVALVRWLTGRRFEHLTRFASGMSRMKPFMRGKEPLANPSMLRCTSFRGEWSNTRNVRILGRGDFNLQRLKVGQAFLWIFPKNDVYKGHSAMVADLGKVGNGTYIVTLEGHSGGRKAELVAYWIGKGSPPATVNTVFGAMRPKPWSSARTQYGAEHRVHVEHR